MTEIREFRASSIICCLSVGEKVFEVIFISPKYRLCLGLIGLYKLLDSFLKKKSLLLTAASVLETVNNLTIKKNKGLNDPEKPPTIPSTLRMISSYELPICVTCSDFQRKSNVKFTDSKVVIRILFLKFELSKALACLLPTYQSFFKSFVRVGKDYIQLIPV